MELQNSSQPEDEARLKLRQRWELASVLNFLSVFEPLIGEDLKLSAEEIETGLISPNASLAKLHVKLLEGIPPVSKNLSTPDAWVTSLCKKLAEWWPWVAVGDIPLVASKGEEISKYKALDPTTRLLMLKALCEVRTEQGDLTSYISDMLKEGKQLSHFRKDKIAEDGAGTSYWYDGNSITGHRLYREVNKSQVKPKHKGTSYLDLPVNNIEWETLATNLDEYHRVLDQFSSHKIGVEAVVYKFIEAEVVPVLEQLQKKRERALKRQQRQKALLNGSHFYGLGITRSCRARRPVSYTFDEFDRTIDEALKVSRKRKDRKEQTYDEKQHEYGRRNNDDEDERNEQADHHSDEDAENEEADSESDEDVNGGKNVEKSNTMGNDVSDSSDIDLENKQTDRDSDEGVNCSENAEKSNDSSMGNDSSHSSDFDLENGKPERQNDHDTAKIKSGNSKHHSEGHQNLGAKNRLRQRPTRNTAIQSSVVSDADHQSSPDNLNNSEPVLGDEYVVDDSEDDGR